MVAEPLQFIKKMSEEEIENVVSPGSQINGMEGTFTFIRSIYTVVQFRFVWHTDLRETTEMPDNPVAKCSQMPWLIFSTVLQTKQQVSLTR